MSAQNTTVAKMLGQDGNIIVPNAFADIMGGLDGGAVLTDLAFWQATHGDWFWRTDALIASRQHVTPYAAKQARGKLIAAGLLRFEMRGQPAKAHYSLDLDAIMDRAGADPPQPLRARPLEIEGAGPIESGGARGGGIGGAIPKGVVKRTKTKAFPEGADTASAHAGPPGIASWASAAESEGPNGVAIEAQEEQGPPPPTIPEMVGALAEARGYPIANFARHVRAAKRLIDQGHGPLDVVRTVEHIRREAKYLDGQPISMETVSKFIGLACPPSVPVLAPATMPDWIAEGAAP